MKKFLEHIERVRAKPHRVRKQVAFASAAVLTVLIALVWFAGSLSTGTFSIENSTFATGAGEENAAGANAVGNDNLAGAGVASAFTEPTEAPAHIEIVDTTSANAKQKRAEQTVIPF